MKSSELRTVAGIRKASALSRREPYTINPRSSSLGTGVTNGLISVEENCDENRESKMEVGATVINPMYWMWKTNGRTHG